MTLSPGDERPRLPGGKIENDESPVQALARELREELALEDDEVIVSPELLPDGILMTEPSPSTHLLTHYKIYPFVVRVVGNGVETLRRQLSNPSPGDACRVWPVTFDHWTESGSGFNAAYARTVVPMLTPELLAASALDAPDELGT